MHGASHVMPSAPLHGVGALVRQKVPSWIMYSPEVMYQECCVQLQQDFCAPDP